jgi:uncharacterized protein (DUF924 family)
MTIESEAAAVLDFWLGEVPAEKRFAKDDALDAEIARRFGALRDRVLAQGAAGWREAPRATLAAIVLLDQFSRNLHRDTAEAFAADPLALELAHKAIARGWEANYSDVERQFLYLPLMHAEDAATQELCVAKCETLGDPEVLAFAKDHRDVVRDYGRFPSRNAALGRETTSEEAAYLSRPDAGW